MNLHLKKSEISLGILLVSSLLGSCNDSSSSNSSNVHEVTVLVSSGGTADVDSAFVPDGDGFTVSLTPNDAHVVSSAFGCGGRLVGDFFTSRAIYTSCQVVVTFAPNLTDVEVPDDESPVVVGALSASNTTVLVQFSEPMREDLLNSTENFSVTSNSTSIHLPVTGVSFVEGTEQQTVRLSTGAQHNTMYTVRVVGVFDLAGNGLSGPQPEVPVSLNSAEFAGSLPGGGAVTDTDGDGLLDHVELAGWPVVVLRTDGSTETRYVSSSPIVADTDNDGVSDAEERHGGLDPNNSDTDGDTLSDDAEWNRVYSDGTKQDTDGDGIQDGFEYLFFKTSPILKDTDGDQLDDPTEVAAGNRNPLIADLPSPRITVGNVNLQLDTRLTFTNEAGSVVTENSSVESTLTQGEDETFSKANEASTLNTVNNSLEVTASVSKELQGGFELGAEPSLSGSATVSYSLSSTARTEQGSERGSTVSFGEESTQRSEEAYHQSLSTETARDNRESITRETLGAAMRVDLTIENAGDLPFSIGNLELTALAQDPVDRRRMIPIASLVPENSNLQSINIGALGDPSRGPFSFSTESVFPHQIEGLMKNPRGLIVQLANFDITDQAGNNFAFTSQQVVDRTAGISFDLGDGRTESYRVATASDHNPDTGVPTGITMARALEIIGLQRHATIRDGGNGVVESLVDVTSDDVQIHADNSAVEPRSVIIKAGADGDLTSLVGGDDEIVLADYETALFAESAVILDGGNGLVETTLAGDDTRDQEGEDVTSGAVIIRPGPDGTFDSVPGGDDILVPATREREVLISFRGVEANTQKLQFWVVFSNRNLDGIDLDDIVLRAGEQYNFAFVQDKDSDKVWAREEYLYGSSDLSDNTDGCQIGQNPEDDPCDTLSDFSEIHEGWTVSLRTAPQSYRVYSNPAQGDSDRDGIMDDVERACGLDPRQRDTDLDGLTDFEEIFGVRISGNDAIRMVSINRDAPGSNVIPITRYIGSLPDPIPPTNSAITPSWVDHQLPEGCVLATTTVEGTTTITGFATDPLNADTDGDFIPDLAELSLGLHPSDRNDGANFLDDDGDGLPNAVELTARTIVINGTTQVQVTSNVNRADSDDDKLPDLLEYYLGSDPSNPDTDGDGILDNDEYRNGGDMCVGNAGANCQRFINRPTNDYNSFVAACDAATQCDIGTIEGSGPFGLATERQLGTNLNHRDTDADALTDATELAGFTINVNGGNVFLTSNPFSPDTDSDGIRDDGEFNLSNPRSGDTDGDGRLDPTEYQFGTNIRFVDKRLRLSFQGISNNVNVNSVIQVRVGPGSNKSTCVLNYSGGDVSFGNNLGGALPCNVGTFIVRPGQTFPVHVEYDVSPNGGIFGGCNSKGGPSFGPLSLSYGFNSGTGSQTTAACVRSGTSGGTSDFNFSAQLGVTVD